MRKMDKPSDGDGKAPFSGGDFGGNGLFDFFLVAEMTFHVDDDSELRLSLWAEPEPEPEVSGFPVVMFMEAALFVRGNAESYSPQRRVHMSEYASAAKARHPMLHLMLSDGGAFLSSMLSSIPKCGDAVMSAIAFAEAREISPPAPPSRSAPRRV